jgi:hypothetical protein
MEFTTFTKKGQEFEEEVTADHMIPVTEPALDSSDNTAEYTYTPEEQSQLTSFNEHYPSQEYYQYEQQPRETPQPVLKAPLQKFVPMQRVTVERANVVQRNRGYAPQSNTYVAPPAPASYSAPHQYRQAPPPPPPAQQLQQQSQYYNKRPSQSNYHGRSSSSFDTHATRPRPATSRFVPPPPPNATVDMTFMKFGCPDDAFYTTVMRWYTKVLDSAHAHTSVPPCPPAEDWYHDFPGWVHQIEQWWFTYFSQPVIPIHHY